MAFVVQLILPVYDNSGQLFPSELSKRVRMELTQKFGGLTAYTRAPAEGTWRDEEGRTQRDDVVIGPERREKRQHRLGHELRRALNGVAGSTHIVITPWVEWRRADRPSPRLSG